MNESEKPTLTKIEKLTMRVSAEHIKKLSEILNNDEIFNQLLDALLVLTIGTDSNDDQIFNTLLNLYGDDVKGSLQSVIGTMLTLNDDLRNEVISEFRNED